MKRELKSLYSHYILTDPLKFALPVEESRQQSYASSRNSLRTHWRSLQRLLVVSAKRIRRNSRLSLPISGHLRAKRKKIAM